ncbi:hypothetical protein CONCODRAFT_20022 [Conidiobolus coronatus NRRL 28638]|uniref:F-box domain-containing protein n=1 Tax=Conidiobolus coronatus (strain ATCC 28846 / CBS 209.66 / NRRL 28638) TaxID=796925 RepID=A0A137NVM3_CONC2|nr:hypothetical protein CONCODRAFT_20022 [Conidiobolus coronatus NRRL 28638]|eukprot:KXN66816.1 hypothetical protein CONCODRAFT_20022 [Conidiobolus coronatus NRRL 28638]
MYIYSLDIALGYRFELYEYKIVIKEFQVNLDIGSFKEVSLISRLVREKLKPLLFENIALSAHDFNFVKNNRSKDFFIHLFNTQLCSLVTIEAKTLRKNLCIDDGVKDIEHSLNGIKKFTKSIYFEDLRRSGFYLFRLVYNIDILTVLKLRSCVIQFNEISKIGEIIPNLKRIELDNVYFVKSPSGNNSHDELAFPTNLYHLEIIFCKIIYNVELSDPYEFLFNNEFAEANRFNFPLPKVHIPSLKDLVYYTDDKENTGLLKFIETNPNLESLNIGSFDYTLINGFSNIKNLEFNYLTISNTGYSFPPLKSTINLKINIIDFEYYEDVKIFCSSCLNLEYLYFKMSKHENFQTSIEGFIEPTLFNLFKLKTFELVINSNWYISSDDESQTNVNNEESIDISKLSNIETLILETDASTILNLKFANSKTLKKVIFSSSDDEFITQEFKNKYNSYKNWKFKFFEHSIKGYKLN